MDVLSKNCMIIALNTCSVQAVNGLEVSDRSERALRKTRDN